MAWSVQRLKGQDVLRLLTVGIILADNLPVAVLAVDQEVYEFPSELALHLVVHELQLVCIDVIRILPLQNPTQRFVQVGFEASDPSLNRCALPSFDLNLVIALREEVAIVVFHFIVLDQLPLQLLIHAPLKELSVFMLSHLRRLLAGLQPHISLPEFRELVIVREALASKPLNVLPFGNALQPVLLVLV